MTMPVRRLIIAWALLAPWIVSAEPARTVTLHVPDMDCPVCPITIRKALQRVDGVQQVTVDLAARRATVVFDVGRTTAAQLAQATAQAGYPSKVVEPPR